VGGGGGGGEITGPIGGVRQSRELSLRLPAGGCSILPLPPREQVQSFIIYSRRLCVCVVCVCVYNIFLLENYYYPVWIACK